MTTTTTAALNDKRKLFDWDVAFTVEGTYESMEQIPYPVLIAALEQRLQSLKAHPDPEAFNCFNISEQGEE